MADLSDDRRRWKQILSAMIETIHTQQSQIETLTDDRTFLEQSLSHHRTQATARIQTLKSHIDQMRKEEDMVRRVHESRLKLMLCGKEREGMVFKQQFEMAESDREDFQLCVEALIKEMLELKEKLKCAEAGKGDTGTNNVKEKEQHIVHLEKEMRKTKHEHKKLILKKDSDIAALLAEKDFIWDQFKRRDDDYTNLVSLKQVEDERAAETLKMLQFSLEELQSTVDKKDKTIANLTSEQVRLEEVVGRLTQEAEKSKQQEAEKSEQLKEDLQSANMMVASLQNELAKTQKSLTKCTRSGSRSASGELGESSRRKRSGKRSTKNAGGSSSHKRRDLHGSSSRSQDVGTLSVVHGKKSLPLLATPRLFSSKFKVPKLKKSADL